MLRMLQEELHKVNPIVKSFIHAGNQAKNESDISNMKLIIHNTHEKDMRRYNQPTASEIAANILDSDNYTPDKKDIVIKTYKKQLKRISELNANEIESESDLMEINENEIAQIIENEPENESDNEDLLTIQRSIKKLDQYAKWESNNLRWYRENQKHLRTEIYSGLQDIISEEDINTGNIEKKVILSSSFTGSARYMQQLYQDSMAIVRKFGKPDLFITVTCNPKWPEITNELLPNQQASNRPDLVARIFKLKLKLITNNLFKKGVLGKVIAYVYVIEFQKRGLPYAHILMILASENKPKTPEVFNKLVYAKIPDRNLQLLLFETVNKNMVHGPCGVVNSQSPCMINGKCSKNYHREFVSITSINKYGYPLYRRRNNGHTITKGNNTLDNRWIVPYNPYLFQKYNCHINVEICSSIRSIKYLYKYVYKGHDHVIVAIKNSNDEIEKYLNARYVFASEAC
ncbi:LOW QUALITY PROTEIN: uncharacterized protein LOC114645498 [Rhizophagus clarus]|uniref:LOW QUALITY PROTEIN: uncharacterized protein LOC114645498 n=1 Tax=Rhizophagus clarus TaxID=94130 RepID=A0A8H3L7M3_9GLOM|nr:LOW QUALITY PROTEIN: uncharacterized protein LOC114645498 [Rhizophagus clarus]